MNIQTSKGISLEELISKKFTKYLEKEKLEVR
jgi:hypothetical protein